MTASPTPLATRPAHGSRFAGRVAVVSRALAQRGVRRSPPDEPQRILIAHHLLLGDTLMLSALVKKLRERHPAAELVMTMAHAYVPLYAGRPWGVRALAFEPRASAAALFAEAPFDLAFVPGDNRYAWLAQAMGARWVVAFAGDRPMTKNWPVDVRVPYPRTPAAWGDLVAALADGPPPAPYRPSEWPAPPAAPFDRPAPGYAVLHVGASSPLKRWPAARWHALAEWVAARGTVPVWSAGRGEEALVAECDPQRRYRSFAGTLDLAQMHALLSGAVLLVAPDTGVAHLGRIVGVPTVALFGPGSALVCGAGRFWRDVPYRAVTVDPFPCRDQRLLFKREVDWVRRCGRSVSQCPAHRCMPAIGVDAVVEAIGELTERAGCCERVS
jgi:ADP-heptose:LPS heptosyltransferase